MKQLDPGYTVKVDRIDKVKWHNFLQLFDDASFYQTWSYGKISWGEKSLSHLVLEKNDKIVSMAQLRIVEMPLLQAGFAYLTWGPMWRKKGEKVNLNILRNMLQALYNEYVINRGYLVKVLPKSIHSSIVSFNNSFNISTCDFNLNFVVSLSNLLLGPVTHASLLETS